MKAPAGWEVSGRPAEAGRPLTRTLSPLGRNGQSASRGERPSEEVADIVSK